MAWRSVKSDAPWCGGHDLEARPNVTVDAAALCLKTGNAVLLRGEFGSPQDQ